MNNKVKIFLGLIIALFSINSAFADTEKVSNIEKGFLQFNSNDKEEWVFFYKKNDYYSWGNRYSEVVAVDSLGNEKNKLVFNTYQTSYKIWIQNILINWNIASFTLFYYGKNNCYSSSGGRHCYWSKSQYYVVYDKNSKEVNFYFVSSSSWQQTFYQNQDGSEWYNVDSNYVPQIKSFKFWREKFNIYNNANFDLTTNTFNTWALDLGDNAESINYYKYFYNNTPYNQIYFIDTLDNNKFKYWNYDTNLLETLEEFELFNNFWDLDRTQYYYFYQNPYGINKMFINYNQSILNFNIDTLTLLGNGFFGFYNQATNELIINPASWSDIQYDYWTYDNDERLEPLYNSFYYDNWNEKKLYSSYIHSGSLWLKTDTANLITIANPDTWGQEWYSSGSIETNGDDDLARQALQGLADSWDNINFYDNLKTIYLKIKEFFIALFDIWNTNHWEGFSFIDLFINKANAEEFSIANQLTTMSNNSADTWLGKFRKSIYFLLIFFSFILMIFIIFKKK